MKTLKKGWGFFEKTIVTLENIMLYIVSIVLVSMTLLITADTISRYFFNKPILGVLEITENIFMVTIVYFAISITSREGGHIKIEFLSRHLPKNIQKLNSIIFNLITVIIFLIIALQSWKQTTSAIETNKLSSGVIEFPMAPSYFIVVIGSSLLCLRLITESVKIFRNESTGD